MSLGHGQLGLLDRLRDFADLMDSLVHESARSSRPYLELQLGLQHQDWAVHSGSIWRARTGGANGVATLYSGVVRDVVGVETLVLPRALTRVEALADVAAGTFFCDIDAATDTATDVYVWLPDSSSPLNTTVVLLLLFAFGPGRPDGGPDVHPWLGPNKLVDGELDVWTSPTDLTNWTESISGGTVNRESAVVRSGSYSARLSFAAPGTAAYAAIIQPNVPLVAGKLYRYSGYYLTGQNNPSGITQQLRIDDNSTTFLWEDGRTWSSSFREIELAITGGQWRRFLFDFLAPIAAPDVWAQARATAGSTGDVYFDALRLQRIYRWNRYEPRLGASAIPETEIASQSILFGGHTLGIGSVSLINGGGEMAKVLGSLLALGKPAQVWVGGSFSDGQEIYRDDWRGAFPARVRRPTVTDEAVMLELEDARALAKIAMPPNRYTLAEHGDMELNREGYAKPLFFGQSRQANIRPTRIDLDAATGYGIYEYLDPAVPVADNAPLVGQVLYSYPNEELADKDLRGTLIDDSVNDYSFLQNNTLWWIIRDIRNLKYDRAGEDVGTDSHFDFDVGAGALVASFDVTGFPYAVAAALQAAMRTAIGGADTTTLVTYDETTHLFRVRRTSGTLNLRPQTGANAHRRSWALLGYDVGSDKTGTNDYAAEAPIFESAELDHILRFRASGYVEGATASTRVLDASAGTSLDTPAAVYAWLLQKVARVPRALVDRVGFKAAHDGQVTDNERLRAYFHESEDLAEVLARLARAGLMTVAVDGEGVWHCTRYTTSTAGAREFFDRDYLSWRMWREPAEVYRGVRVLYGYHPSTGKWRKSHEANEDLGVPLKHGTEELLEIPSYFDDDGGGIATAAALLANRLHYLSQSTPRLVEFRAAGKLVDLLPGDKILLTRTGPGVIDPSGALSAVAFRVQDLAHDYLSGVSRCLAVEDIDLTGVDAMQVDIFTADGTWTKNAQSKLVAVAVVGAGGPGGSGRKGAAGTDRAGGGGGGGGGYSFGVFPASVLGATEAVTVGIGGTGAAAQTTNSTNGLTGTAGEASSFGAWLRAGGGQPGAGGTSTAVAGGTGGATNEANGGAGGNGNITAGGAGASPDLGLAAAGGGGGGGINAANAAANGGAGGAGAIARGTQPTAGTAGTTPGGAGGAGGAVATNEAAGGAGGGGGASRIDAGTNGAGGAGGSYGAGGGGGAAGVDAVVNSGAGGNGAPGIVIVAQW